MTTSVLVSGATGFIGRHLVGRLLADGCKVDAIALDAGPVHGVSVAQIDLADGAEFARWCDAKRYDAIVNLAARISARADDGDERGLFDSNVSSTLNVLSFARRCGARLVHASSCAVYGTLSDAGCPVVETRPAAPETLYAASKYVGEVLCEQHRRQHGVSYACLRISAPYGPGNQARTVVRTFTDRARRSEDLVLFGSGNRTQDFVYVDDVVAAIVAATRRDACGVFNVASGVPVTMKTLAETVLAAVPSSASRIVQGGEPDPNEAQRSVFSIDHAARALGWRPAVHLLDGLRRTAGAPS